MERCRLHPFRRKRGNPNVVPLVIAMVEWAIGNPFAWEEEEDEADEEAEAEEDGLEDAEEEA